VVVAVPQAWIDVRTMADLDDVTTGFREQHNRRMRVATKYINLTRDFFAEPRRHRLSHRRKRRRHRRRARGRHRRTDRRHHHDRRDTRRQRAQGAR
jgi:ATP phosphoribosyltransferase